MSKEYKFNEKIIHALSNISIKFDELGFTPTTLNDENYKYFVDWFHDEVKTIREESLKQEKNISDLEAKLAEAQKTIEIQRMSNDALIDENLDYRYDITDSAYEQAKYMAESWEEDYQQEIAKLKQQLTESEKKFIMANNLRKNSDEVLLNYKTEKYGLDKTMQELRKMKLSLPEKEWYYKGFENCERQMSSYIADLTLEVKELNHQLAQHEKHNAWVLEFLEKYQINTELTPEYSENTIIEYCEQVNDFRAVDNKIIEDLQKELAEKEKEIKKLLLPHFESDTNKPVLTTTEIIDQNKISFTIEQLEKVKEHNDNLVCDDEDYYNYITAFIDNQIKELKEGK